MNVARMVVEALKVRVVQGAILVGFVLSLVTWFVAPLILSERTAPVFLYLVGAVVVLGLFFAFYVLKMIGEL